MNDKMNREDTSLNIIYMLYKFLPSYKKEKLVKPYQCYMGFIYAGKNSIYTHTQKIQGDKYIQVCLYIYIYIHTRGIHRSTVRHTLIS